MLDGKVWESNQVGERRAKKTNSLFEDLQRQPVGDFQLLADQTISLPEPFDYEFNAPILVLPKSGEKSYVFLLHNTLTPIHIQDKTLMDFRNNAPFQDMEIHLVDELLVMKNLPAATRQVLEVLGI